MMSLINEVITYLNTLIDAAVKPDTLSKQFYNIANSAKVKDNVIPYVINPLKQNEGVAITLDDKTDFKVYHKLQSVTSSLSAKQSYGDSRGDKITTYQISMFIFNNGLKTCLTGLEVYTLIQAALPNRIKSKAFKQLLLTVTGGVLNSATVYAQEYPDVTKYPLFASQEFLQLNYTMEVTLSGCFATCSTELKELKN